MDHGSIPVYIPHNAFLIDAEHSSISANGHVGSM